MPRKPAGFGRVTALGLRLPNVEEGISWGSPALKTGGQMMACIPTHKSAEPGSLAVRLDFAQRDELVAADPATYYLKDHYVNYPCVLVRLNQIPDDALEDLLRMAYEFVRARNKRRPGKGPAKAGHGDQEALSRRSRQAKADGHYGRTGKRPRRIR
jgi:hypothetical protein